MNKTKQITPVHIRWVQKRDLDAVVEIETLSFRDGWCWTREDFIRAIRLKNVILMVAERGEEIVGYMLFEGHKTRLELITMAVHPEWRRQGVGAQLIQKLKNKLYPGKRVAIGGMVSEANLEAHLFLRSQAFLCTGVYRRFYDDLGLDGYRFEYKIDEPDEGVSG